MSSAAGQREHRAAFIDAQRAYSDYAIWFNNVHQILTVVTIALTAMTTLAPVLDDSMEFEPNSTESHVFTITSIITGSIATSIMGFLHGAKFYELATKCEYLSLMINVYLSGMVTDEYELERLRSQILMSVRSTYLMWVPVPLLTIEANDRFFTSSNDRTDELPPVVFGPATTKC